MSEPGRLACVTSALVLVLVGWRVGGYVGAAITLALAAGVLVVPWRGQPSWSWARHYLRRNRTIRLAEPVTVANDRAAGGVRYQDDHAVAVVQILGKPHRPTWLTGSTASCSSNTLDISRLIPMMKQSLELTMESLSVVMTGARRGGTGDYPRVYDTLVGTPPYAGQRETWLVLRFAGFANGDALRLRPTLGSAALAAAQRIAADMRCQGIRARVASATEIIELERRLGAAALEPHNRRWHSIRGDAGWLTTYAYRPADINAETLGQAWCLQADGMTQNVTLYPDGTASATVTVRTAQPPTACPSVALKTLPGEQALAAAGNLCVARRQVCGLGRGPLYPAMVLPIGPSGILLGRTVTGDRLLLPLGDPADHTRVHIAAEDPIAKRIIIRAAGSGERITVHTAEPGRWWSMRMPQIAITESQRPSPGTTACVVDGTVTPASRPHTLISVAAPDAPIAQPVDVLIEQVGPASVRVHAAGDVHEVEIDFFRVESRYLTTEPSLESVH